VTHPGNGRSTDTILLAPSVMVCYLKWGCLAAQTSYYGD